MSRVTFTAELPTDKALCLSNGVPVTRDYFLRFIATNPELRTELTAEGEMIVMAPAYSLSGSQNWELASQLWVWAKKNGQGRGFDSSAGFNLPNGATRSPDASWVLKSRLTQLPVNDRRGFLPLCPDFVVELRSKSDVVRTLRGKMAEYMANGARLGWLIDPFERSVHIYRPQKPVEFLDDPTEVAGDPELSGFVLDLRPIFDDEL